MELVNLWHKAKNQEFCMYFGTDKKQDSRHSLSPNRVYRMPAGFSKGFPCLLFYHKRRGIYISKLFLYQKIKFKERKR